ncbi:MAG: hypothetical protein ACR2PF_06765 [Rhizobiaceae bacterium]
MLRRKVTRIKNVEMPNMDEILDDTHGGTVADITVCYVTQENHGRSVALGRADLWLKMRDVNPRYR